MRPDRRENVGRGLLILIILLCTHMMIYLKRMSMVRQRTVHLAMKDNPRLFNIPPRNTEKWKVEY